jgi:hypothetical protein
MKSELVGYGDVLLGEPWLWRSFKPSKLVFFFGQVNTELCVNDPAKNFP